MTDQEKIRLLTEALEKSPCKCKTTMYDDVWDKCCRCEALAAINKEPEGSRVEPVEREFKKHIAYGKAAALCPVKDQYVWVQGYEFGWNAHIEALKGNK